MNSRIIVIALGLPLVYLLLTFNDISRLILFFTVSTISQLEFYKIVTQTLNSKILISYSNVEIFGGNIVLFFSYFYGLIGLALSFFLLQVILGVNVVLNGLNHTGTLRFCIGNVGILYVSCNIAFYIIISKEYGIYTLIGILLCVWALDIGAYTVGMPIRGPKLAPLISPNKTISGSIGGIIFTFAAIYLCKYTKLLNFPTCKLLYLGIVISFFGQISDLFESILKREAKVKDSSTLLGEHGGMLDRIDSLLFLGPITYFVLKFL